MVGLGFGILVSLHASETGKRLPVVPVGQLARRPGLDQVREHLVGGWGCCIGGSTRLA